MDTKKWMTGMRAGLLVLLGIGLSACAAGGTSSTAAASTPYPPPGYAHTVASAHVQLFWSCTRPDAGVVQLAGVAVNPWSAQPIRFLELTLVGVDANERSVSSAKGEAKNFLLRTWESTPFRLDLRTAGSEVRYDLFYQYQYREGDHDRIIGKVAWDGSPERASGPLLLAQTVGFMARDACSDSQHRTP